MAQTFYRRGKQVLSGFVLLGLSNQFLYKRYTTSCKEQTKHNYFDFGVKILPHPEKVYKGGEDANFANLNVLAVADGVGGWADYGVDPALYSKELCKHLENLVLSNWSQYKTNPKQLIIDSAARTKNVGSSTICVVNLNEEKPTLHTSYIGDSGYLVLRKIDDDNIRIVYQSQEQQKGFNFPYQIGTNGDPPSVALTFEHEIKNNDIVVVGTDGLFDNIDENQIIEVIKPFLKGKESFADSAQVADGIAQLAYKLSLDRSYMSPFAKKALLSNLRFLGGKSDDITVVVGQIKTVDNK